EAARRKAKGPAQRPALRVESDATWRPASDLRGDPLLEPRLHLPQFLGQSVAQRIEVLRMQRELLLPGRPVDRGDPRIQLLRELESGPIEILVARRDAEHVLDAVGPPLDAPDHPLEHAHVVAEARPDELAVLVGAEPVHAED